MIQVIDKIRYLSKDRNSIIDTNEILNLAFRQFVENVKNESRGINTQGYSVKITINGVVKKGADSNLTLDFDCENREISEMVKKKLSK